MKEDIYVAIIDDKGELAFHFMRADNFENIYETKMTTVQLLQLLQQRDNDLNEDTKQK